MQVCGQRREKERPGGAVAGINNERCYLRDCFIGRRWHSFPHSLFLLWVPNGEDCSVPPPNLNYSITQTGQSDGRDIVTYLQRSLFSKLCSMEHQCLGKLYKVSYKEKSFYSQIRTVCKYTSNKHISLYASKHISNKENAVSSMNKKSSRKETR